MSEDDVLAAAESCAVTIREAEADPHGGFHLVDHPGTRPIPTPRRRPMVIEINRHLPGLALAA